MLARQLLFRHLALEQPDKLGLGEKASLFCEILGNIKVRSKTADYVTAAASALIKMVSMLHACIN